MLPTPWSGVSRALDELAPSAHTDTEVRLRVGLRNGTVVDGILLSASSDHVSLRLSDATAQLVAAGDISSLSIATRRPVREFLLVTILILAATTVVVVAYTLGVRAPYLAQIAAGSALLGFAAIAVLKRRTRLGRWLTSWRTLFDARNP
jgi:hypothetical protein